MSDAASLVLYLFVFIVSASLLGYGYHRESKIIQWASLLPPILLGGCRYMVGTDYANYIDLIGSTGHLSLSEFMGGNADGVEFSFYLMARLSELFSSGGFLYFFLSSAVTVIFFYLGLKRYKLKNPALVYFLFLLLLFPVTFNAVRQGIAMSIVFYAFSFIMDRNLKKYLIWMILAGLFHTTAFILLPVYFINRVIKSSNAKNVKNFIYTVIVSFVIILLLPYVFTIFSQLPFFGKYMMYEDAADEGANRIFFLKAAIFGILLVLYRYLSNVNKHMTFFIALAGIDLALTVAGFASPVLKRFALYFSIYHIFALAAVPSVFSDKIGRAVSLVLLICYGVLYFYIAYYMLGQSDIFPYEFYIGANNE